MTSQYYKYNIDKIILIQRCIKSFLLNKKNINNLFYLINQNLYINSKHIIKKDKNSLSFLIDKQLTHNQCIKLGIAIEKILYDIIMHHSNYIDIKTKNKKNIKEKDHLFLDATKKLIYYSEIKTNLNLDTEKSKSTCEKIIQIKQELYNNYPNYNIKCFLVNCRYINNSDIPKNIKYKYNRISNLLCGINDYFNHLKINIKFTEKNYKTFINNIVNQMFF